MLTSKAKGAIVRADCPKCSSKRRAVADTIPGMLVPFWWW